MKINPRIRNKFKDLENFTYYVNGIKSGNRFILSKAITLIESTEAQRQKLGMQLLDHFHDASSKSIRIGVSGSPGVGKSTFLNALGMYLIEQGKKVAILAVDPSSQKSKGSILGDKTRMEVLANHPMAYIRPSPSGEVMGGISSSTKEAVLLCEAAGFEVVFIETVGVGQSEIEVSNLVDVFTLLVLPGAGDEIQGIKRGVTEMADLVIIHKADKDRMLLANMSRQQYRQAMHLMRSKIEKWEPKVLLASSVQKTGIAEIWKEVESFKEVVMSNNYYYENRQLQDLHWFEKKYYTKVLEYFMKTNREIASLENLKKDIIKKKITPYKAIQNLSYYLKNHS